MTAHFFPHIAEEPNATPRLAAFLQGLPPHTTATLEPGVYQLQQTLDIRGLHDVTIHADNVVLSAHYDPCNLYEDSSSIDAVHINDCHHLTLNGLVIRGSKSFAVLATVTAIHEDSVDFRLDHPLTQQEKFNHGEVLDQADQPAFKHLSHRNLPQDKRTFIAGVITTTHPRFSEIPCRWFDNQNFQLSELAGISHLQPGTRCLLSHSYYGPTACVLADSTDITLNHVSVPNFGGMAFVVLPRCRNLTFDHLSIAPAPGDPLPMALAADGIHTIGLGGKLTIANSTFRGLCDDVLNAHTQFLTVKSCKGNQATIHYDKLFGRVPRNWGQPGDWIRVCSHENSAYLGNICLTSFTPTVGEDGDPEAVITFAGPASLLQPGFLLANSAYFADLDIHDCTFAPYRRALVIAATDACIVRNCTFDRSSPGVYISGNYGKYLEAGMVSNALIYDNLFHDAPCGNSVFVRVGGPGTLGPGNQIPNTSGQARHQFITIHHNTFKNCRGDNQICANAARGLHITDNTFVNTGNSPIFIDQCENVTCQQNKSLPEA